MLSLKTRVTVVMVALVLNVAVAAVLIFNRYNLSYLSASLAITTMILGIATIIGGED